MAKDKKQILYPTLIMILFTAVMTGILAYVNELTRDQIMTLEALKVQKSILSTLNLTVDLNDNAAIQQLYQESITEVPFNDEIAYVAKRDGKTTGVAFQMKGNALWGSVVGYFALSPEGSQILGVDFLNHSETPGLGGRIDEAWFKSQFKGLPVDVSNLKTAIYRPEVGGNVDAITGATLTCKAVLDMINKSVQIDAKYLQEAGL